jgi:hypothetical protein
MALKIFSVHSLHCHLRPPNVASRNVVHVCTAMTSPISIGSMNNNIMYGIVCMGVVKGGFNRCGSAEDWVSYSKAAANESLDSMPAAGAFKSVCQDETIS